VSVGGAGLALERALDALEEAAFVTDVESALLGELAQGLFLGLRELGRNHDLELNQVVATATAIETRNALPAPAEHIAGLGSGLDVDMGGGGAVLVERRHLDLAAEDCREVANRYLA